MFADNVEHVLTYWILWELTHSPFWLGYAVFAHWAPFVLFSLHAGALADRRDPRLLLQVAQLMYVGCSVALGIMVVSGTVSVWAVAAVLLVHGMAGVFNEPSAQILIHGLVGRRDLMSALSLNASVRQAAQFVGPALGGLLLYSVGVGAGFLVNAALYLPFLWVLVIMRRQPLERPRTTGSGWGEVKRGIRYVLGQRMILALTAVAAIPALVMGQAYQSLMPVYASSFDVGATGYSVLLSASGLGAVVTGVALGGLKSVRRRGALMLWTAMAWAGFLAAFALTTWYPLALVLLVAVGAAQVAFNSLSQTLVQANSPDDLRGRIMGAYFTATLGPRMISGLGIGTLAALVNPGVALLVGAGLAAVAVLGIAASEPHLRSLD
jgi:MFS family permease